MLHDLWRDIRIGARFLLKTPLFTIFASLILAVAIGASRERIAAGFFDTDFIFLVSVHVWSRGCAVDRLR
jgi:hypothetical protein